MLQLPVFIKQKRTLFIVLGVSTLMLVLILLMNATKLEDTDRENAAVTPGAGQEQENGTDGTVYPTVSVAPQTVLSGISDGQPWETTVVADQNDLTWQENSPQNISLSFEPKERHVFIHWLDPQQGTPSYMWLVGYATEPFDPIEKFREENLESIRWNGIYTDSGQGLEQNAEYESALYDFPRSAPTLYFYLYKRTELADGTFRDYVYGANGSANTPFVQKLK